MNNMLKPEYQRTAGYRIYEAYTSTVGNKPLMLFLFVAALIALLQRPLFAAGNIGMDSSGALTPTDFTRTDTADFATNLGYSFTAVRVVGTVVVGIGIILTAIRYRAEEQAQRAQELLVRGAVALLIVNILPTIISFVAGAFKTGSFM